jgi:transmembrane 9 superfamily protein 2/4
MKIDFLGLALMMRLLMGFYMPGAAPKNYDWGEKVELSVNVLSSIRRSAIPYDYYDNRFHFCRKRIPESKSVGLGSILFGDRLFSSDFEVLFIIICS